LRAKNWRREAGANVSIICLGSQARRQRQLAGAYFLCL
jgi:hypothetical protein